MKARLMRARAALNSPGSPWPWIAVALLALLPHLSVLSNPFAYDDWNIIPENPYMVHPHAIRKMFGSSVWGFLGRVGTSNYYRPLMHVFNYLIFGLFGAHPGWFHLFCLLLHVAVALLVVELVRRLSGRFALGWLAGLLFAVHPVHSEVVAWIACSPELLSTLFSLLVLVLYLRVHGTPGLPAPRGVRRALLALAIGAALLLAEFSKEIAVTVPAVIVTYELLVRRRGLLRQLQQCWPEYSALGAATVLYLAARVHALGELLPVRQQISFGWTERLWTCVALFYRYLALLLWPMDLNFFRHSRLNRSPLEPAVLAGFLCIAVFLGLGLWLYRRRAPEMFGLPLYLFPLLPMFQLPYLVTGLLVTERSAYLPSVAFCWLAAAGLMKLADRCGARVAGLVALVILAAYTGRSALRTGDWRDEVGLAQQGLIQAPDSCYLYTFLGDALLRHNRVAEAAAAYREAVRLRSDYVDAYNSLGRAYWLLKQPELALLSYRRAADLSVRQEQLNSASRAWNNIGIVYRSLGRNPEAVAAYGQALRLDPDFAAAHNNLGFALLVEQRVPEAISELRTAIAQDAALAQAHANLGLAYAMSGQWDAALAALAEAERLSLDNAEVQARMGEVYLAQGQAGEARRRFQRALQLHPQNARAQAGLAALRGTEARP